MKNFLMVTLLSCFVCSVVYSNTVGERRSGDVETVPCTQAGAINGASRAPGDGSAPVPAAAPAAPAAAPVR